MALERETSLAIVEFQLGADQVKQVSRILAVEDREGRIQTAALGVFAQQARADAMEGPGPRQRRVCHARPALAQPGNDPFDAPIHLGGRTP